MKTYGYLLNKFFLIAALSFSFAVNGKCAASDYFQTRASGNWTTASTWEYSPNGLAPWTISAAAPNQNAKQIRIKSGHTVTMVSLLTHRSSNLTIDAGGTLVHQVLAILQITPGTFLGGLGPSFTINGTYVLNGTQPTITAGSATSNFLQVNAGGIVRVDDNVLGLAESDNFAYENPRVFFTTDAVYQWNTTTKFDNSANRIYFPTSGTGVSPIFRITQNLTGFNYVGNTNSNDALLINGRFEVDPGITVECAGTGTKFFRDGIGGAGTIIHKRSYFLFPVTIPNCGLFEITGNSASIYGTVTINIEPSLGTDFTISGTATVTGSPIINVGTLAVAVASTFLISGTMNITGSPTINIGTAVSTFSHTLSVTGTLNISGSPNINIGTAAVAANGILSVAGTLTNNSASNPISLTYGTLTVTNTVGGTGTFTANAARTVINVANPTAGSSAGTLRFTPSFNTVYDFNMGLTTGSTTSRVALGSDMNIARNLTLTSGIIVTGANLLTWSRTAVGATLSNPTPTNSFIATCNADGSALNYSLSSPFTGAAGFRINNVGAANTTFPVGATWQTFGLFAATPNRIMINNAGTADNFTVVVKKELLVYTPLSGVNRVWYVSEGTAGGSNVTMNLYFTKRLWNTNAYLVDQDEIETGFIYSDPHLIQKSYDADDNEFVSNSLLGAPPAGDVPSYVAAGFNNSEIFAQYRNGVSPDLAGNTNGIKEFGRFSVFNAASVVLPVSITNIKAYQKGAEVLLEWQALNELSVDRYEIEKSADAVNFNTVVTVTARNNGNTINSYISTDIKPAQGKNFYRIKAIDKDGKVTYTQILSVDISNGRRFISVIPNPVRNRAINLQLNNLNAGKYNIILYSIEGKAVYRTLTEHGGGSSTEQIALPANVSGGAYILKVFNERDNYTERILVQ